jgi:hypothetical protein
MSRVLTPDHWASHRKRLDQSSEQNATTFQTRSNRTIVHTMLILKISLST